MKVGIALVGLSLTAIQAPLWSQDKKATDFESELLALLNTDVQVASKSAEKISDAPGIISVLTKDDIQRFGGTTLADVLNRVPGLLHVSNYFTDRSIMGSRGDALSKTCTNRHVLLLFDGRPVREVQEGGIKSDVYESFPISAIDHIEVIKGPGSVLYGSEAYSGVINIVTEKSTQNSGMVSGSYGEGSAYNHAAKITMASGDFSLLVAGRQAKRPDWQVKSYFNTPGLESEGRPKTNIFTDRTYTHIDSGEGVFVKSNYKNFQLTGSFTTWNDTFNIPDMMWQGPPFELGNNELKRTFLDAGYLFDFSKDWKMSLNATFNRHQFTVVTDATPNIIRNSSESLAEMTHFINVTNKFKMTLGGLFSYVKGLEKLKNSTIVVSDGNRKGYAGYGQLDYQFLDSLKGIAGFQTIKVGKAEVKTVPRAGLIWYPTKKVNVKLLYGEAFRAPYINEILADFDFLKGTATLSPEMVKAVEGGVTYLGDSFELGVSGFQNKQSKLISYFMFPGDRRPTYINEPGTVTIEGGELEGKYYVNRSLYFTGSILAQRCKDIPKATGIANKSGKLGLSYRGDQGVVSLFSVIQGDVPKDLHDDFSPNPKAGSYNLVSLFAEWNLNKTFNWQVKNQVKVKLQGDNLLNKEIWVNALGDSFPEETIPFKKGRVVYLGAQFSF